ncbi:MAG: hypothetical protein HKL95_06395, partial [Phycisphaerae bacterium]|nr:hypothetical protein [Phycisphaerae bacterium]
MNFIKNNLLMIILSLVVVVALVSLQYPLARWSTRLRREMSTSLSTVGVAKSLAQQTIHIPGQPPFVGPIIPEIINRKQQVQKLMQDQAREIKASAVGINSRGRVVFPYGPKGPVIPLLAGVPEPHLLPQSNHNLVRLANFKRDYQRLFDSAGRNPRGWLAQLHAAMPPSEGQIQRLIRRRLSQIHFRLVHRHSGKLEESRISRQLTRQAIFQVAARCSIYAGRFCFQERNFVQSTNAVPSSLDIYNAFVDSWLQSDVVHAIVLTNRGSRDVADSAIKQLFYVRVGANVKTGRGSLSAGSNLGPVMIPRGGVFLNAGAAPSAQPGYNPYQPGGAAPGYNGGMPNGPPGGYQGGYPGAIPSAYPSPSSPAATGGLNYGVGMTGHVGTSDYQVTHVAVGVIIA